MSAWASTTHPQREPYISVRSSTANRSITALRRACLPASSLVSIGSASSAHPPAVQEACSRGVTKSWRCAVSRCTREVATCQRGRWCSAWRRETKCGWKPLMGTPGLSTKCFLAGHLLFAVWHKHLQTDPPPSCTPVVCLLYDLSAMIFKFH